MPECPNLPLTRRRLQGWNAERHFLLIGLLLCLLPGCCHTKTACGRRDVSAKLEGRTGYVLGPNPCDGPTLPDGEFLADGLTEDEAVLVALWNNPAFQVLLVDLQLTRADLIQARLLPNPELWYLNPVGVKQLEYAIEFPIEILWQRPFRVASARFENQRVCDRLVQNALDLIRDVRVAYVDLLLTHGRLRVAEESIRVRSRVAQLAEARLEAGEANPAEAATARIDARQAEQDIIRVRQDVALAEVRLLNLLGPGVFPTPLVLDDSAPLPEADFDGKTLVATAVETRPDAQAAAQAVLAAERRVTLSRVNWFRFLGIIDANGKGLRGHEIGPGFRVTLPIFNRGQGVVARARAELEQAVRQRAAVQNQIALDVNRALVQYRQARAELDFLEQNVRPEIEKAVRQSEAAYQEGEASYLLVLQSTRQLLDILLRATVLRADVQRAWAELERGVGRRLAPPPLPPPPEPEDSTP